MQPCASLAVVPDAELTVFKWTDKLGNRLSWAPRSEAEQILPGSSAQDNNLTVVQAVASALRIRNLKFETCDKSNGDYKIWAHLIK